MKNFFIYWFIPLFPVLGFLYVLYKEKFIFVDANYFFYKSLKNMIFYMIYNCVVFCSFEIYLLNNLTI